MDDLFVMEGRKGTITRRCIVGFIIGSVYNTTKKPSRYNGACFGSVLE
jgi:hypothetical protein